MQEAGKLVACCEQSRLQVEGKWLHHGSGMMVAIYRDSVPVVVVANTVAHHLAMMVKAPLHRHATNQLVARQIVMSDFWLTRRSYMARS